MFEPPVCCPLFGNERGERGDRNRQPTMCVRILTVFRLELHTANVGLSSSLSDSIQPVLTSCPNCQGKVSDQVAVCPHCGAPLLKPVPCRSCGEPIPVGETACPACEAPIGQPTSIRSPTLDPAPASHSVNAPKQPLAPTSGTGLPRGVKTLGIATGAVAALLVLVAAAYLVLRKTDDQCKREVGCEQSGLCSASFQTCVAAASVDCSKSQNCSEYGECTARDHKCVVASDQDCAAICKTTDRCVARDGRCVCDPARAASCIELGKCGVDDKGWCTSFTQQGCEKSKRCSDEGHCTLAPSKDRCIASGEDCARAAVCKKDGRCVAHEGTCVRLDCKDSQDCLTKGLCTQQDNACVAGTDQDCAASTWCKTIGRCKAVAGKCLASAEGCEASEKCKDGGACFVSEDGEACVAKK